MSASTDPFVLDPDLQAFIDGLSVEDIEDTLGRNCGACGRRFVPLNPKGVYCSSACRKRAWRKRRKGLEGD